MLSPQFDIPEQIRMIHGKGRDANELVFQVDLAPPKVKRIELWYNPEGTGLPDSPPNAGVRYLAPCKRGTAGLAGCFYGTPEYTCTMFSESPKHCH